MEENTIKLAIFDLLETEAALMVQLQQVQKDKEAKLKELKECRETKG